MLKGRFVSQPGVSNRRDDALLIFFSREIALKIAPHTNRRYLDALADHVVVFDGAMATSVQACHLGPIDFGGERLNGCNDYLVISKPDVIEQIHVSFLEAGAEVIETDTFRSNRITMR